ncbi:hypothetical protein Dxin01_04288 [Deinococcus xinjiangensis]|uniref:HTH cro/C1-type domain-containing protein n=1 Tax=Deinococcus xinjiangensis TaxID=457454 RepID=A0ABP9VK68_9DEIO
MMQVEWRLRDYLNSKGISAYRLAKAIPHVRQATIYRLTAEDAPQSVSFDVLSQVISGLRSITGQDITPNDLISVVERPDSSERYLDAAPDRAALTGTVQKLKRRGPPAPLAQPTDMTLLVAELRGKEQ